MNKKELKDFLDEKYDRYNRPGFIESDPVSIPHQFTKKEDIEIAGFLAATIAWGQRVTIINNANKMMRLMDNSPHEFILSATQKDIHRFDDFVHRTFNGVDAAFFIRSLKNIYKKHGGLEQVFSPEMLKDKGSDVLLHAIMHFRGVFFS